MEYIINLDNVICTCMSDTDKNTYYLFTNNSHLYEYNISTGIS